MRRAIVVLLALFVLIPAAAPAQTPHRHGAAAESKGGPGVLNLLPPDSVTEHSIDIDSGKLEYTATAGTLPLYDQSGEQSAAIFYTAYVAKSGNSANRPVTFVFNGGPGAASAFLHLGLVGPRIADFGENGEAAGTPRLRDNPQTWLAFTDLVLVDPVGTGWSRAAKPDGGKEFWGVKSDADVMAKVIALYVAKNGRSASPKYLLGESYGGFRAAKVARAVQREQGIIISGIIMISPLLESRFQFGGDRFALGAALELPSLVAAALERRHAFSQSALADAEHFALTDYLTALAGPPLTGDAAQRFYARVAAMTGLPVDVVRRSRGFIRDDFVKHLHAADNKIVSQYDATHAVTDPFPESDADRAPDPVLDGPVRALGGLFVGYARDELKFKTPITYTLLATDVAGHWSWGSRRSQAGVSDDLRVLLAFHRSFHLLIIQGVSDMVTPYSDARYVLDHLPPDLAARTRLTVHRGGHMLYLAGDSRRAMTKDAEAFYQLQ